MQKPWLKEFDEDVAKHRQRWLDLYDKGFPRTFEYPPIPLKDWFNKWADAYPDKPYIIINDIHISYKIANSMARRLANALLHSGVKKGDRVVVMMPNIPQFVIAYQACFKIGAVIVNTNPLYTAAELKANFADNRAEIVISTAMHADKPIQVMRGGTTCVKKVVAVQLASGPVELEKAPDIIDFNEFLATGEDIEPGIAVYPDDLQMLQYTGGTTGVAKGCCLTNAMLLSMAMRTAYFFKTAVPFEEFRTLGAIPLSHIYGYNCNINANLIAGGTIILVAMPSPDNLLQAINKHEPNLWAAVPAMIIGLNEHPDINKSKITSMKGIFCGSAPLAVDTLKRFEELSGGRITEGYGMSETINILTVTPLFTKRQYGSCGLPLADTDLVVVDVETGTKVMPRGELGELIGRGPQCITEYWEKPEETANTVRDGWIYTGDIVKMDEDGFVYIMDRKKDMIISGGFNVYPRDIDEVVFSHPKVLEACTIGVPDEKRGESAKVFVVVKPGETLTEQEIIDYCRESLAPYKVPRFVEFIDAIPRTGVGKADRKVLHAMEKARMAAK